MEPKQNYFIIGLFVVLGTIAMIVSALWVAGAADRHEYNTYQTFFTESVTGLDEGAAVRYRGVNVGGVKLIEIDPSDNTRIRVVMRVEKATPVLVDTVAILRTVGITGIAYVQLEGDKKDSAPLETSKDDKHLATIPSRPSQMAQIVNSVPLILNNLAKFSDRMAKMMDGEGKGGDNFGSAFENINKAAESFTRTSDGMNAALEDVRAAMVQFSQTAATLNDVASGSQKDLKETLSQTARAMDHLSHLLQKTDSFSDAGYADLQATVFEMKKTARDISELTRELKRNPSQLIIPPKNGGVTIP